MPARHLFSPKDKWEGEHRAYTQRIQGVHSFRDVDISRDVAGQLAAYNQITDELQDLIKDAVNQGKTLRAFGSAWSLSKCGVADHDLIATSALTIGFQISENVLAPNYPAANLDKLRFLECGASIGSINDYLFSERLSLKASGSNNGQSLAGVISTGTHGSAFKFGATQDFVVGLHIVTGPTRHVYLQRQSKKVVTKRFTDLIGAELIEEDDTLFNAALVSFGSFGVIHGVMVETRERFLLRAFRSFQPLDQSLWKAIGELDFFDVTLPDSSAGDPMSADDLYHFEVFFNPNEGTPPNEAIVLMMFEDGWHDYDPPVWHTGSGGISASGLDVMGQLVTMLPSTIGGLTRGPLNDQVRNKFQPYERVGTIRDLFRGEVTRGKTLACGIGVSLSSTIDALNIALGSCVGKVLPLLLSVRYVKSTEALLGFTRHGEVTCVLELDAVNVKDTRDYIKEVWKGLHDAGINFTLHWGKFNTYLHYCPVKSRILSTGYVPRL